MQDTYITKAVAFTARAKGFSCRTPFGFVTKFWRPVGETMISYGRTGRSKFNDLAWAAPQSLLQKWIREKHNIHCVIMPVADENGKLKGYNGTIMIQEDESEEDCKELLFDTYELALENCLMKALNLIQ